MAANCPSGSVRCHRGELRRALWLARRPHSLGDVEEVAMNGPYGYDVEFVLVVGGCFMLLLIVASVIEVYMDARKGKR